METLNTNQRRHHHHVQDEWWSCEDQLASAESELRSSWCHRLLRFGLFFNGYHPFEVVLRGHRRAGEHARQWTGTIGHHPSLEAHAPTTTRLDDDEWMRRSKQQQQHLFARLLRTFVLYFMLKSCLISYLARTALFYKHNLPQWEILDKELVYKLAGLLGHPFEPLGDASLLMYSGTAILATVLGFLMPRYYETCRPMDMASLRFLLRPQLEVERVDLFVRQKIHELSRSVENLSNSNQLSSDHNTTTAAATMSPFSGLHLREGRQRMRMPAGHLECPHEAAASEANASQTLIQEKLRARLGDRVALGGFRPRNYSAQWFRESSSKFAKLTLSIHLSIGLWYAGGLAMFYRNFDCHYVVEAHNDGTNNVDDTTSTSGTSYVCDPYKLGSFSDNWVAAEVLLLILICYQLFTFNVGLFGLVVMNYLESISAARQQLAACKRQLEAMNLLLMLSGAEQQQQQQQRATDAPAAGPTVAAAAQIIYQAKRDLMLDGLIRVLVFEHEITTMAGCLSEQVAHFFVPILVQLLFSYLTNRIDSANSALVRKVSTLIVWLTANLAGLVCAHTASQLLKLQSNCWSVLAENARHELLQIKLQHRRPCKCWRRRRRHQMGGPGRGRPEDQEMGSADPLTRLWQKFVLATNMNLTNYSARPFKVTINYGQLIELDFLGLFMYSLVRKF